MYVKPSLCRTRSLPAGYTQVTSNRYFKYYSTSYDNDQASCKCKIVRNFLGCFKESFSLVICLNDGAQLGSVSSQTIFEWVYTNLPKPAEYWIGINGFHSSCLGAACNGILTWFDGTPFDFGAANYSQFRASDNATIYIFEHKDTFHAFHTTGNSPRSTLCEIIC